MLSVLSLLKPSSWVLPIALVAVSAVALYVVDKNRTIRNLQQANISLNVDNQQLQAINASQKNTIDFLQKQAKMVEQKFKETQQSFIESRQQADSIKKQLEIGSLAPSVAQTTINNTSNAINRCYELLSGAQAYEKEINSVCPWLINR